MQNVFEIEFPMEIYLKQKKKYEKKYSHLGLICIFKPNLFLAMNSQRLHLTSSDARNSVFDAVSLDVSVALSTYSWSSELVLLIFSQEYLLFFPKLDVSVALSTSDRWQPLMDPLMEAALDGRCYLRKKYHQLCFL